MNRPVIFDSHIASEARKLIVVDLVELKDMYKEYLIDPGSLEKHFVTEEPSELDLMHEIACEFDYHARRIALKELRDENS